MTPAEFAAGRRIYGQWVVGNISTDEAIRQMGTLAAQRPFPDSHPYHTKFKNHREWWVQTGWNMWDHEMGLTE